MVEQVRFSSGIIFFKEGFMNRWGLKEYYDKDKPCYFAGVYRQEDVDAINNHRGLKIVWNAGDIRPFFTDINPKNVIVHQHSDGINHSILGNKYIIKKCRFEIKDLSQFKPNPLGDSVYCYLGKQKFRDLYGGAEVDELAKLCKFNIITTFIGHPMDWLIENAYNKCFVYFKPGLTVGGTSAIELAYMGRKSISNTKENMYIPYKNIYEVLQIIDEESKKIGTIQPNTLPDNFYDTGNEWLNEKFWI